jgi:hypothetical protein
MRNSMWILQAICLLGVGVLFGCVSTLPPAPVPVTPLLVHASDLPLMAALVHEQERRVEACEARKSCSQDLYLWGLLALFHSREQAVAAFRRVQADSPNSRLAGQSTSWVELLQASPSSEVSKVMEDLIWEVLERELSELASEPLRTLWSDRAQRVGLLIGRRPSISSEPVFEDKATVQGLRKRLRERERIISERDQQITVLSSQLDALKQIDHETQTKRRTLHSSK